MSGFDQEEFKEFLLRPNWIPFDALLIDFCEVLSRSIFNDPLLKPFPALQALGFWLRGATTQKMVEDYLQSLPKGIVPVPLGRVFHIAPANVEALFVYSWILSHLAGNANIVRLPSKRSEELDLLFIKIQETLQLPKFYPIRKRTLFVQYGHEKEVTAEISTHVDGRVIWGGDETVQTIRSIPLNPRAKEIVFPDRFSYSIIESRTFLSADERAKDALVRDFFNDCFWYDQNTCSSPRLIFWVGQATSNQNASDQFYKLLKIFCHEKKLEWPWGALLERQTDIYQQAAHLPVKKVQTFQGSFAVIELAEWSRGCRDHRGFGLLYHMEINSLHELTPYVEKRDQTLCYFGFSLEELHAWIRDLNGKGLERVVPIGKALQFSDRWDGYSLLHEFTRWVDLQ